MSDIWAVIPVKRFATAKSRLAPVLGDGERRELAERMFEDVLDSLLRCRDLLAGTIVATADHRAAMIGRRRGATVVLEEGDQGINAAVRHAIAHLDANVGTVIVPSDIPQLSSATIAIAVDAIARPQTLAIAEAPKDGGTNLLACRPAASLPLHFGVDSYVRHLREAQRAGLSIRALHLPDLLLDIDGPDDLRLFQGLRTSTRTHAFLSALLLESRSASSNAPERDAPPEPAKAWS